MAKETNIDSNEIATLNAMLRRERAIAPHISSNEGVNITKICNPTSSISAQILKITGGQTAPINHIKTSKTLRIMVLGGWYGSIVKFKPFPKRRTSLRNAKGDPSHQPPTPASGLRQSSLDIIAMGEKQRC